VTSGIQLEERCPRCDYSLAGLPDKHRCPECGFEYERRMLVIRQSSRYTFIYVGLAVFCVIGVIPPLLIGGRMLLLAFNSVCVAGMFLSFAHLRRRNRAVLSSRGFSLISRNGPPREFRWREVGAVEYKSFGGGVTVRGTDGNKLHEIPAEFFGSQRKVRQFLAAADEWRARYRKAHKRRFP